MRGSSPRSGRPGRWALVLVAAWAAGLGQSAWVTADRASHGDIYADIERYADLHEILGDTVLAGFRPGVSSVQAARNRRWRPQYAAMPTVLRLTRSDRDAIRMARARVRATGSFHLLYGFRRPGEARRFSRRIRVLSRVLGCTVTEHEIAPRALLYQLDGCRDG